MQDIPFKQTEVVTNETLYLMLIIIFVLVAAFISLVKYLKAKGFVAGSIKASPRINVVEQKLLSATTRIYVVRVDDIDFVVTESSKNIQLANLSNPISSHAVNLETLSETKI